MYDFALSGDMPSTLGRFAGIFSIAAFIPYLYDTLTGRTRPQRASWLIWAALSAIALATQIHEGAKSSLWFAVGQTLGTSAIFLAALRYGTGGLVSRRDCALLAIAGFGLVLWAFTETAAYALAITISISCLGASATLLKAYAAPSSETLSKWAITFVAAILALISTGGMDPVLVAYPIYLIVLNGAMVCAILAGRMRLTGRAQHGPHMVPGAPLR